MNAEKLAELVALFREAVNHLEFCGYGDSYERECARDENLPQRLQSMISELNEQEANANPA